ncbi:hypothetical protein PGT21_031886 [Puccinia graminis f. sp. tritici]|uniref:FAD/NAD(P)-binding domain-containing protein n=2 Tax=Puccinia graminis f. sp. tritici TaxID=56615 RepID=E3JTF9_PUCGT|nr:uncharacterized protein PGTG_01826 [Puccinia graminis f. sp. tritici CRL 75-36-700-3]EFP75233.1 hypothetical protein PGTG_01826 [Puccinia graminis f. sp. tritici CRL 75-36-700-3]KAA1118118.1 hypothetical protein PGT21_031886 [Puccinia graminis f. sp. tritici]
MSTGSENPRAPKKEEQACYQFVVVGAGPAGLTAVANLIDMGVSRIAWIDLSFSGGRMGEKYREIPSNTKIQLFLDYVAASPTFSQLVQEATDPSNAYTALENLELDRGNQLSYAADLMIMLTRRLVSAHSDQVDTFQARAKSLDFVNRTDWMVEIEMMDSRCGHQAKTLKSRKVIFATGSEPVQPKEKAVPPIDLEVALSPSQLEAALEGIDLEKQTIAVVGSSHSAFLVLRNLISLSSQLRIVHLYRNPKLIFAEQKDGWILYDNTGLKGVVADWAKEEYPSLVADRRISRTQIEDSPGALSRHLESLASCSGVIYAIGYRPAPTPTVTLDGLEQSLKFDHSTGRFDQLNGLFGCGIAFPQRTVDPLGNVEHAVGIFKFMKFLKAVVPLWIQS